MITQITTQDEDGTVCLSVTHAVTEYIIVKQYEDVSMDLSYEEARSLMRALSVILDEVKDRPTPTGETA